MLSEQEKQELIKKIKRFENNYRNTELKTEELAEQYFHGLLGNTLGLLMAFSYKNYILLRIEYFVAIDFREIIDPYEFIYETNDGVLWVAVQRYRETMREDDLI